MFKKTIPYLDLDGHQTEGTFHFGLDEAELTEFGLSYNDGDLEGYFKKVMLDKDRAAIIALFKDMLTRSVGHRSEDGRRFVKTDDISAEFLQTGAYAAYFMEMMMEPQKAIEFIIETVPASMKSDMAEGFAKLDILKDAEVVNLPEGPMPSLKPEDYTTEQLLNLTDDEWTALMGTDPLKMSHGHLIVAMQRKNRSAA